MNNLFEAPAELIRPSYKLYRFTDGLYKLVFFKSVMVSMRVCEKEERQHYESKLDASLSRSRRAILEYSLCNDWKYFCSFTLDKTKYDRYNLDGWFKDFSQWIRDQRKKYKGSITFSYLFIPERHEDGAWHIHGFFSDISPLLVSFAKQRADGIDVPDRLVNGGYYNWVAYQNKFGFCSFGLIRDKYATAFYSTKYVTKDLCRSVTDLGAHLYYHSHGLARPSLHGDIYGYCGALDKYLTEDYEFCKTGFCRAGDQDWSFGFEYMDFSHIEMFNPIFENSAAEAEADAAYQVFQECFL